MTELLNANSPLHDASKNEQLRYFEEKVIVAHPALTKVLEDLDQKANPVLDQQLVLLLGPSGVGKTAAMDALVKRRCSRGAGSEKTNHQIVPAIRVEAEAPNQGKFSFGPLFREALENMHAASIDKTLPMVPRMVGDMTHYALGTEYAYKKQSEETLKLRFRTNLIDREVSVLCIDEAINIFKIGSYRSKSDRDDQLKEQADKLKTLANKTPTVIILAGAYDFFNMTLVSAQVARRSTIVHMEPYGNTEHGLIGFTTALLGLMGHLPIKHKIDIREISTELFLQSLGCVGLLKNILTRALSMAFHQDKPLTQSLLRKAYFPESQLAVMRHETELGVKAIREILTSEILATYAPKYQFMTEKSQPKKPVKLKPGETKPSHRHESSSLREKE